MVLPLQILCLGACNYLGCRKRVSLFAPQNASAQAALQAAQALAAGATNETQGGPNTVLRVIIEHMVYPVTLEVLYQVSTHFCMFLSPYKIIVR